MKDYINHLYRIATIRVFRESSGENELKCNHTEVILMQNFHVIDSDYIYCDHFFLIVLNLAADHMLFCLFVFYFGCKGNTNSLAS